MKKVVLILVWCFIHTFNGSAQSISKQMFEIFCTELIRLNENVKLKGKLKSINTKYDVVDDLYSLDTLRKVTKCEKKLISNITEEELLQILLTSEASIFPLSKKIYIGDTLSIFEKNDFFKKNGIEFNLVDSIFQVKLSTYAVKVEDSTIFLSLRIGEKMDFLNLQYGIDKNIVKLLSSKILHIDNNHFKYLIK